MSEKLKRGGPFPDGLERQEAKLLRGYPTWNKWKHVVENRLRISFKNTYDEGEELCHEFYLMRRRHQRARAIDETEVLDFWQRAEEQIPGFGEEYREVTSFIARKTPVESLKS